MLNLEASGFEMALGNYHYVACLFYDSSAAGQALMTAWEGAAAALEQLPEDAALGQVDGTDGEMKEVLEAYGITVPSIRVFRRSVMGDYRGPSTNVQGIADYIKEDALVRATLL